MVLLRNRLLAILPAVGTARWEQQHAKCTRQRIMCTGAWGMDEQDARTWLARTLGIDGASADSIREYVRELDARAAVLAAQLSRDRVKAFREKVQKAVRDAKDRLITGWVGKEAAPPISVVLTAEGKHLVQPMVVADAFAREWGQLWKPPPGKSRGTYD